MAAAKTPTEVVKQISLADRARERLEDAIQNSDGDVRGFLVLVLKPNGRVRFSRDWPATRDLIGLLEELKVDILSGREV